MTSFLHNEEFLIVYIDPRNIEIICLPKKKLSSSHQFEDKKTIEISQFNSSMKTDTLYKISLFQAHG